MILAISAAPASASTGCSTCWRTAIFGGENYPPFDLIKLDDNQYRIEVAVAGFRPDEIDITASRTCCWSAARRVRSDEGPDYVHRGIANRSFERRFALADHIQVNGADLKDGMLAIELVREIPEAMKPRKIEIGGSAQPRARPDRGDGQRREADRAGLSRSGSRKGLRGARRFRGPFLLAPSPCEP